MPIITITKPDGTVKTTEPTIEITTREYAELVAKAERLRLLEKATKSCMPSYQINPLFFDGEGES